MTNSLVRANKAFYLGRRHIAPGQEVEMHSDDARAAIVSNLVTPIRSVKARGNVVHRAGIQVALALIPD